jgi:hypothetical protein
MCGGMTMLPTPTWARTQRRASSSWILCLWRRRRLASLKPIESTLTCLAFRVGHLVPIWQPCIGSLSSYRMRDMVLPRMLTFDRSLCGTRWPRPWPRRPTTPAWRLTCQSHMTCWIGRGRPCTARRTGATDDGRTVLSRIDATHVPLVKWGRRVWMADRPA